LIAVDAAQRSSKSKILMSYWKSWKPGSSGDRPCGEFIHGTIKGQFSLGLQTDGEQNQTWWFKVYPRNEHFSALRWSIQK